MSNFPKRSVTSTRLVFCTVTGRLGATATSCLCSSSSTSPASVPTSAWWQNISSSHQQQRHVFCCVPLGLETHVYEFPSRKYHSTEVGSHISKCETRNSASTPTSDNMVAPMQLSDTCILREILQLNVILFAVSAKCRNIYSSIYSKIMQQNC